MLIQFFIFFKVFLLSDKFKIMDGKNWWKELRNNKAFQVFKRYLHNLINQLNEREIQKHMYKKGLNIDDILIEESSKEIEIFI